MKIIQVIPVFGMGGAEIMCENLVYELKKIGHEVIVVSLYSTKTPITERMEKFGIDILYLNKRNGFDFSIYKKLERIFQKENPDVIHTHIYVTKYVFPVATKLNIKVVHTVHSIATQEMGKISRKVNEYYFKKFDVIPVALSSNVQSTIIKEYGLKSEKVPIVLNGIDLNKCNAKKDYHFKNKFKIVHVGSFSDVKNHFGLIEAFEIFHRKYSDSELHLIGEGKNKDEIEKLVGEKDMLDCVTFWGRQSNVHQFLSDMDIFTLPSLYEGIPMSIIEAMGTGLPIVATNVGGIPDMLNQNNAQLVPVNIEAIAGAFEKYYLNYDLRKLHGENALQISTKFSAENMAKMYLEIYYM